MTDHAVHSPSPKAVTGGLAAVAYGGVTYLLFLGTFLYAIAFVANLPVPKTIDSGHPEPFLPSLVINALLLGVFAIQHSVMARPAFKRWWTRSCRHPSNARPTCSLRASPCCCSTGSGGRCRTSYGR